MTSSPPSPFSPLFCLLSPLPLPSPPLSLPVLSLLFPSSLFSPSSSQTLKFWSALKPCDHNSLLYLKDHIRAREKVFSLQLMSNNHLSSIYFMPNTILGLESILIYQIVFALVQDAGVPQRKQETHTSEGWHAQSGSTHHQPQPFWRFLSRAVSTCKSMNVIISPYLLPQLQLPLQQPSENSNAHLASRGYFM